MGQRLTGMTANQTSFLMVGSFYDFKQYGEARAWISDLFPHTAKIVDDICIVKSMFTSHQSRSRIDVFPNRCAAR
jgi:hypothetical protein